MYLLKAIIKHIIFLVFLLGIISSFGQKVNLDSLFNDVKQIDTFKDYQKFLKFQSYLHQNTQTSKIVYNPNYSSIYIKALNFSKQNMSLDSVLKVKYYTMIYYNQALFYNKVISTGNELIKTKFSKNKEIVNVFSMLTNAYLQLEQYDVLLDLYPLLYEQIEKHNIQVYRIDKNSKNNDIAFIYYRLENYEKALEIYRQGISINLKSKDFLSLSSIQNNIGLCYAKLEKRDSANYFFKKALSTIKKHKTSIVKNVNYTQTSIHSFVNIINANLADTYITKKKYDKALQYYFNELNTSKITNKYGTIIRSYEKIANTYFKKGDITTSMIYLDSLNKFLKSDINNVTKMKYYDLKAKCFLVKHELDSAGLYFKHLSKLKNSLKKEALRKRYNESLSKFEIDRKEKELLISNQENEKQKSTNKFLWYSLTILGVLLISLLYILYRSYKDKKVINKQNKQAKIALNEKNILLKEVHHRVKNNLQVINSILELQNLKIKDSRLNTIIEQGQNRIHSMALIHQQLYQNENISEIVIKKYISDLITNVANFNNRLSIKYTIYAKGINFKINTAVPLGLIINELVTNIYKHAFKENKKGKFSITIVKEKEHHFKLSIKDNGKGLSDDFDIKNPNSLGLKLVQMLTKQLKGTIKINSDINSTEFIIFFRDDVAV